MRNWFVLAWAGLVLATVPGLRAGEKIEFGTAKSKIDPASDSPLGKQLFKWREKLRDEAVTPDVGLMTPPTREPIDPRKERLRKEKLEDQRNWMVNGQPTRQEEKEAFLKELEGDSDSYSREEERRDRWYRDFKNKQAGGNTAREPGKLPSRKDNVPQPAQYKDEDDDVGRSFSKNSSRAGAEMAAPTYTDIGFKRLFEPPAGSSAASVTSIKLDTDSYGANSGLRMGREQDTKREEFRAFLNGGAPSSPGMTLPAGDPGLGSAAKAPFLSPIQNVPGSTPAPMSDPFASPGSMGRFGSPFDSPSATVRRDLNPSGVSGLGTLPPSGFGPTFKSMGSTFDQPPTRARGMNSLGGH